MALALQVGEEWKSLEAWCFDSGSSFAAASFVATEVDGSGAAVCRHPQGAPVASAESVGGFFGGKESHPTVGVALFGSTFLSG